MNKYGFYGIRVIYIIMIVSGEFLIVRGLETQSSDSGGLRLNPQKEHTIQL